MIERLNKLMEMQENCAKIINDYEQYSMLPNDITAQSEYRETCKLFAELWEEIWELERQISNEER